MSKIFRGIEQLETRTLLSSATLSSGILTLTGNTSTANTIYVTASGASYIANVNGTQTMYSASSVDGIKITGGSVADVIDISADVLADANITGGAGNDTIRSGGGNDTVAAGAGNDLVYGQSGSDSLSGEDGNDTLYGGGDDDRLNGNYGQDYSDGGDGSTIYYNTQTPNSKDTQLARSGESTSGLVASAPPKIVTAVLVNADTDEDVMLLGNNATINLADVGTSLNIRIDVAGVAKSTILKLDGGTNRVESAAPFTATETSNWNYLPWTPSVGSHSLVMTAYDQTSGKGNASPTVTLNFTVSNSGSTSGGGSSGGGDDGGTGGSTTAPPPPTTTPGTNAAPTVKITSPTASSSMWGPGSFLINTTTADSDGTVQRVDFFNGSTYLGTAYDAPFNYAWTDVAPGSYTIKAVAYDNDGAKTTSTGVNVSVVTPAVSHTYYVSTGGSDSNSGSSSAPYKTINKAAQIAKAGDVVIIKPGTYREQIVVANSGTTTKPIIFKAETPGTVVVDGADVLTSWSKDTGTTKPIYTTNWSYDFFKDAATGDRTYGGHDTASSYAEQLIWNGKLLNRVDAYSNLAAGTFSINYSTNKLSVYLPGGVAPSTGTVAGTTKARLMSGKSIPSTGYVQIEDITFRHAANFPTYGAIVTGTGWRLVDVVVEDTNGRGISVNGNDTRIINTTSRNNGQMGIGGSGVDNVIIDNSASIGNNTKFSGATWDSGGGKWTRVDGLYLKDYVVAENYGFGIWFDLDNQNVSIVGGHYRDNITVPGASQAAAGIMIEISGGPFRIDGAMSYGNEGSGIIVAESTNVSIRNSTFSDNLVNISLRDIAGRTYDTANIKIMNNKIESWRQYGISLWTRATTTTNKPSVRKISADGNTYDATGTNGSLVRWDTTYSSLTTIRSDLGIESTGKTGTFSFVKSTLSSLLDSVGL